MPYYSTSAILDPASFDLRDITKVVCTLLVTCFPAIRSGCRGAFAGKQKPRR